MEEATDWHVGKVVVPISNGTVRICVNLLTKLNESICHEKHPILSVDQTLGQLVGAKYFSKLDAKSGFWQIPLSEDLHLDGSDSIAYPSELLLPFRITSVQEHFQRRSSAIFSGLDGHMYRQMHPHLDSEQC